MPNFIGFSTIGKDKKFTLVDGDLIKQDLANAFNIRAGSLPGRPEVGTKVWDYIFDPNDSITSGKVESEIRRIIKLDKRLELLDVVVTDTNNTINAYVSINLLPNHSTEDFYITFVQDTQIATIT